MYFLHDKNIMVFIGTVLIEIGIPFVVTVFVILLYCLAGCKHVCTMDYDT